MHRPDYLMDCHTEKLGRDISGNVWRKDPAGLNVYVGPCRAFETRADKYNLQSTACDGCRRSPWRIEE